MQLPPQPTARQLPPAHRGFETPSELLRLSKLGPTARSRCASEASTAQERLESPQNLGDSGRASRALAARPHDRRRTYAPAFQCGTRRTTTRTRYREDDSVAGHLVLRRPNERARGLVLRLGAAGRLRRRATGASLLAGWCSRCARTCSLPLTSRSPRGAKRAAACGTRGRAARPSPAAPEAARCIL